MKTSLLRREWTAGRVGDGRQERKVEMVQEELLMRQATMTAIPRHLESLVAGEKTKDQKDFSQRK